MLTLEPNIYLRVEQLDGGPRPLPLDSGFNRHTAYRALGMFNPSETSDAYFIFSNDRDEIWFICNRHLRCLGIVAGSCETRMTLEQFAQRQLDASVAACQAIPWQAALPALQPSERRRPGQ